MTRAVGIIQARTRSTRLPGKVLLPLGDSTVLAQVLARCGAIAGLDAVCCATSDQPWDDPIAARANEQGALVFRGSETDVLRRFHDAARATHADIILRVTADCPLLDPAVCGDVLALHRRQGPSLATNNHPPSWPHGLDCEVFGIEWLERADREATNEFEREHVAPYIRRHPNAIIANHSAPFPMPEHRWTLDTPADYSFLMKVFAALPGGAGGWSYKQVLSVLAAKPALRAQSVDPLRKRGIVDTRLVAGKGP